MSDVLNEKFWVEEPCNLVTDLSLLPTKNMTREEKFNALSRLVIIVTIILYIMKYKHWYIFLSASLLIIITMNYSMKNRDEKNNITKEEFTVTPTYTGSDFQQTIVSPTFSEEWQIPPPAYDEYSQTGSVVELEEPLTPQSYPYGQYLSSTNLLPSDEYYTRVGCGGTQSAREYANSAFLRHDLAYKENMTRLYKKKLDRRFRHNCNDVFSPYHSF